MVERVKCTGQQNGHPLPRLEWLLVRACVRARARAGKGVAGSLGCSSIR